MIQIEGIPIVAARLTANLKVTSTAKNSPLARQVRGGQRRTTKAVNTHAIRRSPAASPVLGASSDPSGLVVPRRA